MSEEEYDDIESNEQWYLNKRFSNFWQSYSQIMLETHHAAIAQATQSYMRVGASLSNHMLPNPSMPRMTAWPSSSNFYQQAGVTPWTTSSIKSGTSSTKLSRTQRINRKKSRKRKLRRKQKQMQDNMASESEMLQQMSEGMHITDSNDEDMNDIPEDYLAFLLKTEQHRSEYLEKKAKKNKESSVLPSLEESQNKEHPDLVRSREMQQLYGESSPRIHAMETAVQLSFDRISTLHHPGFWPSVPINWNA